VERVSCVSVVGTGRAGLVGKSVCRRTREGDDGSASWR
jgi:hypothetical protein